MDRETGKYWDAQINMTGGCTHASEGCANCYAEAIHRRFHGKTPFSRLWFTDEPMEHLDRWRKPRVVFVSNTSDLFHEDRPDDHIHKTLDALEQAVPGHTYLILTKRAPRMLDIIKWRHNRSGRIDHRFWFGVTAENQQRLDERLPHLLATPAAHRWLSLEPLIGGIALEMVEAEYSGNPDDGYEVDCIRPTERGLSIDLVTVGGETGPKARSCNVDWIRSIVQQCKAAGVPCWVKQLGGWPVWNRDETFRYLQSRAGRDMSEWPVDLRVREMPEGLQ